MYIKSKGVINKYWLLISNLKLYTLLLTLILLTSSLSAQRLNRRIESEGELCSRKNLRTL